MYSEQSIMLSLTQIWNMHVTFRGKYRIKHLIWFNVLKTRIISFKQFMEPSELLYNQLKINSLKNSIILNNCLFVFDNLTNNLPDVFDQFFKPFKELHNHNTRRSQQYLLNIPKTNSQIFGSNSIKTKSINDWNKMIHKIHFSSELLLKRNDFIKLVKNTFVTWMLLIK